MLQRPMAFALVGLSALLCPLSARAEKPAGTAAIVAKAIKAAGGEENLTKHKGVTFQQKGKFYGFGDPVDYTAKGTVQLPDKIRMEIEGYMTTVVNGDKGWNSQGGGDAAELSAVELAGQKDTLYLRRLTTLVPLRHDHTLKLTALPDSKVDGHPAAVLKVSSAGHRDATLFFDKETGLLSKIETTGKGPDGKEVPEELSYGGYRDLEGAKLPTTQRVKLDGKPFIEAENTEIKFVDTVDPKTFQKP